jgi:argininosuccinate lyase
MRLFSQAFDDDVRGYIDPDNILKSRKTIGGASYAEVKREITREKKYLGR